MTKAIYEYKTVKASEVNPYTDLIWVYDGFTNIMSWSMSLEYSARRFKFEYRDVSFGSTKYGLKVPTYYMRSVEFDEFNLVDIMRPVEQKPYGDE